MNARLAHVLLLAALGCAQTVLAADNTPDPAFGDNGTVYIDSNAEETVTEFQQDVVLLHDSFVYVLNEVIRNNVSVSRVTRFDRHGVVDPTFGVAGHADLSGLDGFYDEYLWRNGLIDVDGRLYLVGRADIGDNSDMLACRLLPDGVFDLAWGGNGTGCTSIAFDLVPQGFDVGLMAALQPNGRLLVAGSAKANGDYDYHVAIARLNAIGLTDGSLNGGTGKVTLAVPGWASFSASAIALDSQQRIVVAGTTEKPELGNVCDRDFGIARLLPDGAIDNTFGAFNVGWDLGPTVDDCAQTWDGVAPGGLTLFPDDSMLVVGDAQFTDYGRAIAAVKITKDAEADASFGGGDGKMHRYVCDVCTSSYVASSGVQADGKIVVVGAVSLSNGYDVFVSRLLPDGSEDIAFDGGAAQYFDYATGDAENDETPGLVAVAPGRIVFAGTTATLEQDPTARVFVTTLGETAEEPEEPEEPVVEIPIFSDQFE